MKSAMPHDEAMEKSVLGGLMTHRGAIDEASGLSQDLFWVPAHKRIFGVLKEIADNGTHPDLIMVTQKLTENGGLEHVGGAGVLTELYSIHAFPARDMSYPLGVLRDRAIRRRMIETAARMQEVAKDPQNNAQEALADASEAIMAIDTEGERDGAASAGSMIHSVLVEFERAIAEKGAPRGVPTGYRDFDYITGGLRPGNLVLIAGRPAMGKSALMLNMADRMAAKEIPVLIYSMEMPKEEMMQRILCSRAAVAGTRARNGYIGRDEQKRISKEGMILAGQPLYIDDSPAPMIADMRSRARREVKRNGIKCIFVDYVQLIRSKGFSRENEVGEVSRNLKAMAMELGIPVVAAAQLNRQAESRSDNRPKLSDLRESGSLEQDADIVTLIYRGGYYSGEAEAIQEAEWTVAKHRAGKTGPIPLIWNSEFTRFDSAAIHREEPPRKEAYAPSRDLLEAIQ
jgi:replicative DNA helicase